jgi:hypothetical protein
MPQGWPPFIKQYIQIATLYKQPISIPGLPTPKR